MRKRPRLWHEDLTDEAPVSKNYLLRRLYNIQHSTLGWAHLTPEVKHGKQFVSLAVRTLPDRMIQPLVSCFCLSLRFSRRINVTVFHSHFHAL